MYRLKQIEQHLVRAWQRGHQSSASGAAGVSSRTVLRHFTAATNADLLTKYRPNSEAAVLDSTVAYYDSGGEGTTLIFLHGNPTSSFLWRKVINVLQPAGYRCIAPDLVGFGKSGKSSSGYRFLDHAKYLDEFLSKLDFDKAYLIIHDWGSALGFRWIRENASRVKGVAHMESIVRPLDSWDDFPKLGRKAFQSMRTAQAGEEMVLDKNFFVERLLLGDKVTKDEFPLTDEEQSVYRERFVEKENRVPVLQWPREIPIEGSPADVVQEVQRSFDFMSSSPLPKLFIEAKPGFFSKYIKESTKNWPNQTMAEPVVGLHFMQEDSGERIGQAVLTWLKNIESKG